LSNFTPSRLGQVNSSGDAKALFLKVFSGEVMSQFQVNCVMRAMHYVRTIASGKSAQFPLHVWLPDAMEGPTPVSALIHAATMVTAGVYMIVRNHAIFDLAPMAMTTVAWIGGLTALFAATIGLVQTDIKRVLAYSTVSQLGYMFLGCGLGAYTAAVFHLMTHAFFKALLFLSAGSVIHALSGEQDIRKMGALKSKIPWTHTLFLIGTIAIAAMTSAVNRSGEQRVSQMEHHSSPPGYGRRSPRQRRVAAAFLIFASTADARYAQRRRLSTRNR